MRFFESNYDSTILTYHHVCRHLHPCVARVTPRQFEKQIKYLAHNKNKSVCLSDYFNLYPQKYKEKQSVTLITFDDALSCLYDNALPLLLKYNMKATIFVITDFIGKVGNWDYYQNSNSCNHLSWSQLRELHKLGFEIGSHSHSHTDLKSSQISNAKREIEYSKNILEDKLGTEVNYFSFPFGRFNNNLLRLCKTAGYKGAVTMKPDLIKMNQEFTLPRYAVYLFDNLFQFQLKLKKDPPSRFEKYKLKMVNFLSIGTILLKNINHH